MDKRLYDLMGPAILAAQVYSDDVLIAAGTFRMTWGEPSGLFGRIAAGVDGFTGGRPELAVLAIGPENVYVHPHRTKDGELDLDPPVHTWKRTEVSVHEGAQAGVLMIEPRPGGPRHRLIATSTGGEEGEIAAEIFRLLGTPLAGAPAIVRRANGGGARFTSERTRRRFGEIADEIEAELKRLGWWTDDPPSEEHVLAGGAFGLGTTSFVTWLQVVFVRRLREVAAGTMALPNGSEVGAMAAREFDGAPQDVSKLAALIDEVDVRASSE